MKSFFNHTTKTLFILFQQLHKKSYRFPPNKRTRNDQRGMTLTEVIIVLAIVGLFMGVAGFYGFRKLEEARENTTKVKIKQLQGSYVQWNALHSDEGCPSSLAVLTENKKEPKDDFGQPFIYKCPSEHSADNSSNIDITSIGKDKKLGTPDDIKSWELK